MSAQLVNGYWENPAQNDKAGTFAVIIGVSRYDNLPDSTASADLAATYGLGQLHVSASTAFAFFDWLQRSYSFDSAPLSKCWVLLSPTDAELQLNSELKNGTPPTLQACQDALSNAAKSIEKLHPSKIAGSRFLFFFSGHGLERYPTQLLCPSDYLRVPGRNPNHALSTLNLRGGLRKYPLADDFYFIDACRSNPREMADIKLEGTSALVEMPAFEASTNRNSVILWGTKSGAETWQPSTPSPGRSGLSIFGRALLEALEVQKNIDVECGHPPGHFTVDKLHAFTRLRVQSLLESYGQTSVDPVRKGGDYSQSCVSGWFAPPAPPVAEESMDVADPPQALEEKPVAISLTGVVTGAGQPGIYAMFQNETLSEFWESARAFSLAAPNVSSAVRIDAFEWIGKEAGRVTISVMGIGAHWLQLDDRFGLRFAALLPGDPLSPTPQYEIEFARQFNDSLRHFDVNLARTNIGQLGVMAGLWKKYCEVNAKQAVSKLDASLSEDSLAQKTNGPLAATVGGLLLLRARRYDQLHNWLKNVAALFPYRSDGAILRAEQVRQMNTGKDYPAEVLECLLAAAGRPLPQIREVFGYALDQTREALSFGFKGVPPVMQPLDPYAKLKAYELRLDLASRYAKGGGLCTTFVGPQDKIRPELVLSHTDQ